MTEAYLGDGVYASFDGYQIWLRTDRDEGRHVIALEPAVFEALVVYASAIEKGPQSTPVAPPASTELAAAGC